MINFLIPKNSAALTTIIGAQYIRETKNIEPVSTKVFSSRSGALKSNKTNNAVQKNSQPWYLKGLASFNWPLYKCAYFCI